MLLLVLTCCSGLLFTYAYLWSASQYILNAHLISHGGIMISGCLSLHTCMHNRAESFSEWFSIDL